MSALAVPGPCGTVEVPVAVLPDDPYLALSDDDHRALYYADEGYVVARGLLDAQRCASVRAAFDEEVRPHHGFLFRQTTGRPERHAFSAAGHVLNPILNVQDLDARAFPRFREAALGVLTDPAVSAAVEAVLGEPGAIVQTMCFEANPATPAHQDGYYLDSTRRGSMVAAWVALEDIPAGAGRFFVFPRSHRSEIARNAGDFDVAFHHARYHEMVVDCMRRGGLACRAPALRRGDVLLWNALTVHGSLPTMDALASRFSLTAHFIPASTRLLKLQRMPVDLRVERVRGVAVHRVRPLDRPRYRLELELAGRAPRAYAFAKRLAIRALAPLTSPQSPESTPQASTMRTS